MNIDISASDGTVKVVNSTKCKTMLGTEFGKITWINFPDRPTELNGVLYGHEIFKFDMSMHTFTGIGAGATTPDELINDLNEFARNINGYMAHETVLTSASIVNQNPVGLDNPLQLVYGGPQGSPTTPVELFADGSIRFNEQGRYKVILLCHFGRDTGAGESVLVARNLINGVQSGISIFAELDNQRTRLPFTQTQEFTLTQAQVDAGIILTTELIRDSGGVDNGGLIAYTPSPAGWAPCPSIQINIIRIN